MEVVELLLGQYGAAVTLICGFLFVMWKGTQYSLKRLLDQDTGILTHVAEEHIKMMRSISTTQATQHIDILDLKKNLRDLLAMHRSTDTVFTTKKLHEAGLIACDILEDIANESDSLDIKDNLRKIRNILNDG